MARITSRSPLAECSGAVGDLGTFIPHVIGAITVAGLAPFGVLLGFGLTLIGSGLFYGIPMAVQPMKAVSAIILTSGLSAREVAATGMVLGVVLLVLGITGFIEGFARLIPQSVSAGLQLGLGLLMAVLGVRLTLQTPWLGFGALALIILLGRVPNCPAALITLIMASIAGWISRATSVPDHISIGWGAPILVVPMWSDVWESLKLAVLPQLALTLTNAVIVTAGISRELFPSAARAASERNLAISSGLANVLLSPIGAMPMCHGAGGVQAQYRFGARTGFAPIAFGVVLLAFAIAFSHDAAKLFAIIPTSAVGGLLIVAGGDLAVSKRLFDSKPSCWPVIAGTAALTLFVNPAVALALGWVGEVLRTTIVRRLLTRADVGIE